MLVFYGYIWVPTTLVPLLVGPPPPLSNHAALKAYLCNLFQHAAILVAHKGAATVSEKEIQVLRDLGLAVVPAKQ